MRFLSGRRLRAFAPVILAAGQSHGGPPALPPSSGPPWICDDVREPFQERGGTLRLGSRDETDGSDATRPGGMSSAPFGMDDRSAPATPAGPPPASTRELSMPSDVFGPFTALPGGQWRLGNIQVQTWHVGPGGHSLRAHTRGTDGSGGPWASLLVLHEHPSDGRIRSMGWHPDIPAIGRGTRSDIVTVGDGTAEATGELHQPGALRRMRTRWTFGGPSQYRAMLLEDPGTGVYGPLAEWEWIRSSDEAPAALVPLGPAPIPSAELAALQPLIGADWTPAAGGLAVDRTSIGELDHLAVVHARVLGPLPDGTPGLQLEAFIHHHVGTGTLRCLALHHSGDVYEGGVRVLDGGSVSLELLRHRGGAAPESFEVRIDPDPAGSSRVRIWAAGPDGRELRSDTRHTRPIAERP